MRAHEQQQCCVSEIRSDPRSGNPAKNPENPENPENRARGVKNPENPENREKVRFSYRPPSGATVIQGDHHKLAKLGFFGFFRQLILRGRPKILNFFFSILQLREDGRKMKLYMLRLV